MILQDPAVENLTSFIGVDGENTTMNNGRIQITLKPLEERDGVSAVDVIRRLQPKLAARFPGITLYMQPVQDLTVEDRISRTQYQYRSGCARQSDCWTSGFRTLVDEAEADSRTARRGQRSAERRRWDCSVVIDRDTAGRLGITPQNVDDALYDAFGQRQVSTIFTQSNQYHVVLEAGPQWQQNADSLKDIYVQIGSASANLASTIALAGTNTALTGAAAIAQAPLGCFHAAFKRVPTPITINHQGAVSGGHAFVQSGARRVARRGGRRISGRRRRISACRPASSRRSRAPRTRSRPRWRTNPLLILAAIVTVYIVLGVLYESYIHPITILSTLPSAGVGAIAALILFHEDLDVIALIGIILLIGIVKKNAIMMIDFALEAERKEGKTPEEAIYQACLLRFRPIMMTTMAALLGAVPLAFGSGVGSELRKPLGITIIGGLLVSQVLTLFTTPVIYLWFGRIAAWVAQPARFTAGGQLSVPEMTDRSRSRLPQRV